MAFACDRYGNFDIFIVSVDGGQPERLTFNSVGEVPHSFTRGGDSVVFRAMYMPKHTSGAFYNGLNALYYKVPLDGSGRADQLFYRPSTGIDFNERGFLFEDVKGNEDAFRKHHVSSVTRDILYYDQTSGEERYVIERAGEDRNARFAADGDTFFFLSERDGGSMNVYRSSLSDPSRVSPVTQYTKNPVRSLSVAKNGTLCYSFEGRVYTQRAGETGGQPLSITIRGINPEYDLVPKSYSRDARSACLSPDGKEVAYIVRGDVFVTNIEHKVTRRITNTPEQERTVDFCSDGRTLVYDSERNGSWNLYTCRIKRDEEKSFAISTELEEQVLLEGPGATFQPLFSPDGKEVAFLQDRTRLMVIDVASKKVRQITDGSKNYSYSDGDLSYAWSPDGQWLVMDYNAMHRWPNSDIGIMKASGEGEIFNLTLSGYSEIAPQFAAGGDMIIWMSDRHGMRAHASWGSQNDIYAFFTTPEAYEKFTQSDFERENLEDLEAKKKEEDEQKKKKKDKKEEKDAEKKEKEVKPVKIDFNRAQDRFVRLTDVSGSLNDMMVTPDGKSLYYLTRVEDELTLWKMDLRKIGEKKQIATLPTNYAGISLNANGNYALISGGGTLIRLSLADDAQKNISYSAQFEWKPAQEREFMYNHVVQQVRDKFYRTDLHGVDWDYYAEYYKQFLPHINNNYDFADMLSELLGELNASHTGSGFRGYSREVKDNTASLGIFFDRGFTGGILVTEVLPNGPFGLASSKMAPGAVITHIDGAAVTSFADLPRLLNRKGGARVRVRYKVNGVEVSEVVKPVSRWVISNQMYERWVEQRRAEVDSLSKGRLGYVHIRSMGTSSFHRMAEDLFGRYNDREGVVIDTRYNGGGHMHEDIEVMFSGIKYLDLVPREQLVSEHPRKRWKKPSVMLISEANYSNAHGTPWVYKTMGLGTLVGQPVPGTMTSVWWETLIDESLYFGVPIVGYIDRNGNYLENQQLEPDVNVKLDYRALCDEGRDTQIEKAVEVLLKQIDETKGQDPWPAIDAKYKK